MKLQELILLLICLTTSVNQQKPPVDSELGASDVDVQDYILARYSILNNVINQYLLIDNLSLSIITGIGFLNNRFYPLSILKNRKLLFHLIINFIK